MDYELEAQLQGQWVPTRGRRWKRPTHLAKRELDGLTVDFDERARYSP